MNKKIKIIRAVTVDASLCFVEPLIQDLKDIYEIQLLSSPGGRLPLLCDKYNIKGHSVAMYRRMSPFKDIVSLCKIIMVFIKEKPDMVHSMTPKAGLLCMLAAFLTGVKVRVHTFTGLVWPTSSGIKRKILLFTDWLTCACATHIIPEGFGVMNDLQQHVTNKGMKVLGFGNIKGVDMHLFSKRPEIINKAESLKKNNIFTFIFVGRLVKDKGINELISAFDSLNKKHPLTRLILIGNYEQNLDPIDSQTINTINDNKSIEAVGSIFGDDLIAYYAASDCLVFPSYREGFPNVVLEAGAMGLPCIVTDINGSREIIVNDRNGVIIPSKDIDALFTAMEKMLLDKACRDRYRQNARKMINERFEQSFVRNCLYQYYKEIL